MRNNFCWLYPQKTMAGTLSVKPTVLKLPLQRLPNSSLSANGCLTTAFSANACLPMERSYELILGISKNHYSGVLFKKIFLFTWACQHPLHQRFPSIVLVLRTNMAAVAFFSVLTSFGMKDPAWPTPACSMILASLRWIPFLACRRKVRLYLACCL